MDAHYKGAKKLGHGDGYKYAHLYPNHYVEQEYLPEQVRNEKFFELSENGYEKEIKSYRKEIGADK